METYVLEADVFSEAEYSVCSTLMQEQNLKTVEGFDIQSLRQSPIKEIASQFSGDYTFIATLKDVYLENDGTEKTMRYKVLLWANNLTEANANASKLIKQGYDLVIEGIKQVDYEYLTPITTKTDDGND